jgi:ATP-dependent exoDNAse (exonuclease V) alpha subunit
VIELTHIFRQQDKELQNRLNRVRKGRLSDEEHRFWESQIRQVPPDQEDQMVRLFPTNAEAEALNMRKLAACGPPSDQRKYRCKSFINAKFGERWFDLAKDFIRDMMKNCLAQPTVTVALGAYVMLVANLDVKRGLANGVCGYVTGFVKLNGIEYPRVNFQTYGHKNVEIDVTPFTWTYDRDEEKMEGYTQIPLRLAWGCTVHKSQGMTFEKAAIAIRGMFAAGQAYTALSRIVSLAGLYLTHYDRSSILTDAKVRQFYEELEARREQKI